MSLTQTMRETWQHFLETLHPDDRQKLAEALRSDYQEQAQALQEMVRVVKPGGYV